jgi:hypothetical protein
MEGDEMSTLDCPACSGPDNAECETCGGTSLVTQETYDSFVVKREAELDGITENEILAKIEELQNMIQVFIDRRNAQIES